MGGGCRPARPAAASITRSRLTLHQSRDGGAQVGQGQAGGAVRFGGQGRLSQCGGALCRGRVGRARHDWALALAATVSALGIWIAFELMQAVRGPRVHRSPAMAAAAAAGASDTLASDGAAVEARQARSSEVRAQGSRLARFSCEVW